MRFRWQLSIACCLFAFASFTFPSGTVAQDDVIESLINQLASKNPAPDDDTERLPPEEKSVWAAVLVLHTIGTKAYPQLIAHMDDDRYSFSEHHPRGDKIHNRTVGRLCHSIISKQVKQSVSWGTDDRSPGFFGESIVPSNKEDAQKWWAASRNKELWELQVDDVVSVINQNRAIVRELKENSKKSTKGKRSRDDEDDYEGGKLGLAREAIDNNLAILLRLLETRQAIPEKPFARHVNK